jgi:hypothetical protein
MKRIVLTLCVFIALATADNAAALYRCVDKDGNSMLTDSPPPGAKCEGVGGSNESSSSERQPGQASRRSGCEIVNFSQYEVASGGGSVVGGHVWRGMVMGASVVGHKNTCVGLTIRNNDRVERTLTNAGIVAVTDKGNKRNPKGFMTRIRPGGIYQGDVCFGQHLSTISELECNF